MTLKELRKKLDNIKEYLDLESKLQTIKEIEEKLQNKEVWNDYALLQQFERKKRNLQNIINQVKELDDELTLIEEMILQENDESLFESEIQQLSKKVESFEVQSLLSGPHDEDDAIVTIHSGAGGTESCDWVAMLFRMYAMWAQSNNYKIEIADMQEGDQAGYKSITFIVSGDHPYGYLKGENGIHRLVRISPFDSNKRRHTSFAAVSVIPDIENDINIDIKPEDLKIDTFRASGAGGQYVNKTDSAIRITHLPTGIVVTCQTERSQMKNKATAMKILKSKLYKLEEEKKAEQLKNISGEKKKVEWGSQIRSYVLHPYKMVKDHRTNLEKTNVAAENVLNGDINDFLYEDLKYLKGEEND
ncbi:MAG TPA: peptide chain release factor 2 [Desulfurella acetivorans]|nr:peptide chain release factor 2 [Desulfurella multipotens]PMP66597.1 MAG: peptide chain release factor 2 [Desulfurella multipotens]HEX13086.1 peptide chain release factor 2 [Desulfurella acetivorans]